MGRSFHRERLGRHAQVTQPIGYSSRKGKGHLRHKEVTKDTEMTHTTHERWARHNTHTNTQLGGLSSEGRVLQARLATVAPFFQVPALRGALGRRACCQESEGKGVCPTWRRLLLTASKACESCPRHMEASSLEPLASAASVSIQPVPSMPGISCSVLKICQSKA